jgi:hypothetical protein
LGCSKGYAKLLAERALLKEHRLEKLETHTHELQEDKP